MNVVKTANNISDSPEQKLIYVGRFSKEHRALFECYNGPISTPSVVSIQERLMAHELFDQSYRVITDLRNAVPQFSKKSVIELVQMLRDALDVFQSSNIWIVNNSELTAWARYFQYVAKNQLPIEVVSSLQAASDSSRIPMKALSEQLLISGSADIRISC